MSNEWFVRWFDSPYYHILYQGRDDAEARLFIDHLIQPLGLAKGARILDLACGKGRHSRYLAEKGFEVSGLDISPANITYARQFERKGLTFFLHDMRQPFPVQSLDAIVNIFTSFGYFNSEAEHVKTLENVRQALRPGGLFLMDYFNATWVRSHLVQEETKTLGGIRFRLKKKIRANRVCKEISFETSGHQFQFRERVRLFTLTEFEAMFKSAGLQIREKFGGYDLSTFDPEKSNRLILIAEKKGI